MKTVDDIYNEIGIPCYYCKHAFSELCICLLANMVEIAADMVLRGEY
ncbi:MAG TPA: hypothetical protein P5191_09155 [Ruminococcus sp.]|nr:hypothetical protein [Ruminococcus sp.]